MDEALRIKPALGVERWLPTDLVRHEGRLRIRWSRFDPAELTTAFDQSLVQATNRLSLESGGSEDPTRVTEAGDLLNAAVTSGLRKPIGLIFDLSYCGARLVVSALKDAVPETVVLFNAKPVYSLFLPYATSIWPIPLSTWTELRPGLLTALGSLYAQDAALVIKFNAWNILEWALVRSTWSDIPCLILVRSPKEVLAANLIAPSDWMKWYRKQSLFASEVFGTLLPETAVEFGFFGIRRFCQAALNLVGDQCQVVDYSELNSSLEHIASWFGINAVRRSRLQNAADRFGPPRPLDSLYCEDAYNQDGGIRLAYLAAEEHYQRLRHAGRQCRVQ